MTIQSRITRGIGFGALAIATFGFIAGDIEVVVPPAIADGGGTYIAPDITHRAIRGKAIIERTPAMVAAEAHLQRLQEVDHGTSVAGSADGALDLAGVSDSHQRIGDVAVRIPRHERALAGGLPEALGTSLAASDVIPFELNEAVKAYAAKQAADEDDEMAMIIILSEMV